MKELAEYIRRGLKADVREDKHAWGIADEFLNITANVVGLALIGKIGLERAQKLYLEAFQELNLEYGGPATAEICRELSLSLDQFESLVVANFRMTASEIALNLENGTFQFD